MRKKFSAKQGFTLVELLVVLAIIGILAAIAVPVYSAHTDKAKERVCFTNRTQAFRLLLVNQMLTEQAPVDADIPEDCKCPSGGKYTIKLDSGVFGFSVGCSKHGEAPLTERLHLDYQSLVDNWKEISGGKWGSNDNYRNYIYEKNGNQWPTLEFDSGETLYIQPYIEAVNGSNSVYIYANKRASGNGGWEASYIYDKDEACWYTGKSIKFTNQSWEWVKAEMEKKNWTKVDPETYTESGY